MPALRASITIDRRTSLVGCPDRAQRQDRDAWGSVPGRRTSGDLFGPIRTSGVVDGGAQRERGRRIWSLARCFTVL